MTTSDDEFTPEDLEIARQANEAMQLAVKCGAMLASRKEEVTALAVAALDGKLAGRFLSDTEQEVIKIMAVFCRGHVMAGAFDRLREASAEGVRERPEWDRRLVQARRAVEKAAAALRQVDGG